jgi:hypothetical protein
MERSTGISIYVRTTGLLCILATMYLLFTTSVLWMSSGSSNGRVITSSSEAIEDLDSISQNNADPLDWPLNTKSPETNSNIEPFIPKPPTPGSSSSSSKPASNSSQTGNSFSQPSAKPPSNPSTQQSVQPISEKYAAFLKRIAILDPPLQNSVHPWNETANLDTSNIQGMTMIRYPELPTDDSIWCKLKTFGFTQEQADRYFDPKKTFSSCGDPKNTFLKLENNKMTLDCPAGYSGDYLQGTRPDEEVLGEVRHPAVWKRYTGPVDIGQSEFGFGKCTKGKIQDKHAFLVNKYNATAAARANKRTQEIAKSLNATEVRPLSVYLVLFDSLSRQHFYRNFPETIKFLNEQFTTGKYKDKFAMYDFIINNAHGENTQPNMVPILYGYNLDYHLKRLEGFDMKKDKDHWKFKELQQFAMWKHYERLGYMTLFGFDTVWDFLSRSTGRTILTDHVASNFWHECKKVYGLNDFTTKQRCFGVLNSHTYMLNYILQFQKHYEGQNRFGYTHISPAHEDSGTVIRTADLDVKNFFKELFDYYDSHPNEDLVLMFASDHGKHTKEWDEVPEGYYENRLPTHFLFMNKQLIARLGSDTDAILRHNAKSLITRLDWHLTFKHISVLPYGNLTIDSPLYKTWINKSDSQKAISLLMEKVPVDRNCAEMDIPNYYCTCLNYVELPLQKAMTTEPVISFMKLAIDAINKSVELDKAGDFCMKVSLKEVLKVEEQQLKDNEAGNRYYKIKFTVKEQPLASFDMLGFMSNYKEFKRFSIDQKGGRFPSLNITFTGPLGNQPMSIQVQDLIRIDPYRGICEEIARQVGTSAGKCLCYNPQNTDFSASLKSSQQKVFEELKKEFYIKIGDKGASCSETCMQDSKVCQDWGLQLFNSEEMLEEPWLDNNSYKIEDKLSFKGFKIKKSRREGNVLGINQHNELILAEWDDLSCDNSAEDISGICPCT